MGGTRPAVPTRNECVPPGGRNLAFRKQNSLRADPMMVASRLLQTGIQVTRIRGPSPVRRAPVTRRRRALSRRASRTGCACDEGMGIPGHVRYALTPLRSTADVGDGEGMGAGRWPRARGGEARRERHSSARPPPVSTAEVGKQGESWWRAVRDGAPDVTLR
jgi:hypothetical protein